MKIWVFQHHAVMPQMNGLLRHYRFARELGKGDAQTVIFAGSYQYFSDENLIGDNSLWTEKEADDVRYVFVRTHKGHGLVQRLINNHEYYSGLFRVSREYAKKYGKPDVIVASSPDQRTLTAGIKIGKRMSVPVVCEVRDLYPEAIFNIYPVSGKDLVGKYLLSCERRAYEDADAVIFTKEGDTDHLKEEKWTEEFGGEINLSKCFYINNGISLRDREIIPFEDEDLEDDSFRAVYSGSLRYVNNIDKLLDTAKYLKDRNIKFLIYGDGYEREALLERIRHEKIDNCKIKGFVQNKYLPYILSKCHLCILNYSGTKYNWSRGMSSNKLFEYMAGGKPVLSTVKSGYSIIERIGCGVEVPDENPAVIAEKILEIMNMPKEKYNDMCEKALLGVKEFDYEVLAKKFMNVLEYAIKNYNN
ncbi:MAG: glycosyltransferase family 4 protein [Armatimonadetes bacterium]|nr:glycosyltransferase family 4 protein [Candidatus Hippobium faecium]